MRAIITLAAGLSIAGCNGSTQAGASPLKMHRIGAGTPDATGWVAAESTEGAMKAQLPCRYNDFTVTENNPAQPVGPSFTIGCKRPDGLKFSVVRAVYRGGEKAAAPFISPVNLASSMPNARIVESSTTGRESVDVSTASGNSCAEFRFVRAGSDNIIMTLEAATKSCASYSDARNHFFNSLEFGGRPDASLRP
jgi:hypothetical protein